MNHASLALLSNHGYIIYPLTNNLMLIIIEHIIVYDIWLRMQTKSQNTPIISFMLPIQLIRPTLWDPRLSRNVVVEMGKIYIYKPDLI